MNIASGERTRLIFLGRILDSGCRLASYLGDAIQYPNLRLDREGGGPVGVDGRENIESLARQVPCTIHAYISREAVQAAEGSAPQPDSDNGEMNDWSFTVLRVTSGILLTACWYHRITCPSEYNVVSTGILCAFTFVYFYLIRSLLWFPLYRTSRT